MKVVLTGAFIALTAVWQTQTSTQANADLVVLKFSWSKYVMGSGLISPIEADPAPGPAVINRTSTRDPNYQGPSASPTVRNSGLATLEQNAAQSTNRSSSLYVIRIKVKNAGTKPIKSFVWAPDDSAEPSTLSGRQFFCTVKTKPNETKGLEILSPVAPSQVVDASKGGDKKEKNQASAVINWIEFVDGSSWQRPGWDASSLSDDARPKLDGAKCVRF